MSIKKISFSYPRDSIQSVYSTEEMTALELAAVTSQKVDECVDLVNGVEQSAIEASSIVDDMKNAQDQFMTENADIRSQLVTDNQNYIDTLTASKTQFETDINAEVETIVSNANATIQADVTTKIDGLVADGTIEGLINDQILLDVKDDVTTAQTDISNLKNDVNTRFTDYEGKKYQIVNPYKGKGSLALKGQLHCHTTNSDGLDSPASLVGAYQAAGYKVVAITDHDFITPDPLVNGVIFLPSIEEGYYETDHVPAYDVIAQSTSTDTQAKIDFHRANGKLCSLAHPGWLNGEETHSIKLYDNNFVELFNGANYEYHVDNLLTTGHKVFLLAVDDCHDKAGTSFNKGYVVIHAQAETKDEVLKALRAGQFYASTGNDISIELNGNVITATSSANSKFEFIGENGKILNTVNGATSATYTIQGYEMYVRVRSTRISDNKVAWSQPLFIDTVGGDYRTPLKTTTKLLKPAPNKNILINYDWLNPVNQRGITTLNIGTGIAYFLDHWRASRLNITVDSTGCKVAWDGVNGTEAWVEQHLEGTQSMIGKTVTCSAIVDGVVYKDTVSIPTTLNGTNYGTVFDKIRFMVKNIGGIVWFGFLVYSTTPINITKLKLEIGMDCSIDIEPSANYMEQLAYCQRYLFRNTPAHSEFIRAGQLNSSTIYFDIPTPVPMKANPTLEGSTALQVIAFGQGTETTGFTFTYTAGYNSIRVTATKAAHGLTDAVLSTSGLMLVSEI